MDIIKEFEGIIGALLGVIVTMMLNEYFKLKGKAKFYFDNFIFNFLGRDECGGVTLLDEISDCEYMEYNFLMQIYNSSESKKILRNIEVEFYKDRELIIKYIPLDYGTNKKYAGGYKSDELRIININSKEIIEIEITGHISKSDIDLEKLNTFNKVVLKAKDNKDKEIITEIYIRERTP